MSHFTIPIVLVVSLSLLQVCPTNGYQQQTRRNNRMRSVPSTATSVKIPSTDTAPKPSSSQTLSSEWQPMAASQRHNWIITHTDSPRRSYANAKLPYTPSNRRHPVNYYAYKRNNVTGNYETLKASPHPHSSPSYQLPTKNLGNADEPSSATTHELYSLGNPNEHIPFNHRRETQITAKLEDYRSNKPQQQKRQDHSQSHALTSQSNDDNIIDNDRPNEDAFMAQHRPTKQTATEIFEPLRNVLENVQIFCKVFEHIISNEDEMDTAIDEDADEDPNAEIADNTIGGHHVDRSTLMSHDGFGRSIAASGRKVKKFKKKLKKLLLPLLIAYKLKFLTLIPVLIGGLTLLVGTTGLAGFFFALFTAVMSLKTSAGHKSIVVKKL